MPALLDSAATAVSSKCRSIGTPLIGDSRKSLSPITGASVHSGKRRLSSCRCPRALSMHHDLTAPCKVEVVTAHPPRC
jgi:hypothetical protein